MENKFETENFGIVTVRYALLEDAFKNLTEGVEVSSDEGIFETFEIEMAFDMIDEDNINSLVNLYL